jgi:prepilin-type processing-associated H-X9-DG protein
LAERTCRFVAACAPAPLEEETPWRGMSPHSVLPVRAARTSWYDVAAVFLVMLTAGVLILPAVLNSRLRARVTLCQNHLRQFGQALAQYSHEQNGAITRLAGDGRLTLAGIFAAKRIKDGVASDAGQVVCPDSWLAIQNALCYSPPTQVPTDVPGNSPLSDQTCDARSGPLCVDTNTGNCPGFRVNENGPVPFVTAKIGAIPPSALLGDAPLVDLSAQAALDTHGGQGRNVFFADGHAEFLPCSATSDMSEAFLSRAEVSSAWK